MKKLNEFKKMPVHNLPSGGGKVGGSATNEGHIERPFSFAYDISSEYVDSLNKFSPPSPPPSTDECADVMFRLFISSKLLQAHQERYIRFVNESDMLAESKLAAAILSGPPMTDTDIVNLYSKWGIIKIDPATGVHLVRRAAIEKIAKEYLEFVNEYRLVYANDRQNAQSVTIELNNRFSLSKAFPTNPKAACLWIDEATLRFAARKKQNPGRRAIMLALIASKEIIVQAEKNEKAKLSSSAVQYATAANNVAKALSQTSPDGFPVSKYTSNFKDKQKKALAKAIFSIVIGAFSLMVVLVIIQLANGESVLSNAYVLGILAAICLTSIAVMTTVFFAIVAVHTNKITKAAQNIFCAIVASPLGTSVDMSSVITPELRALAPVAPLAKKDKEKIKFDERFRPTINIGEPVGKDGFVSDAEWSRTTILPTSLVFPSASMASHEALIKEAYNLPLPFALPTGVTEFNQPPCPSGDLAPNTDELPKDDGSFIKFKTVRLIGGAEQLITVARDGDQDFDNDVPPASAVNDSDGQPATGKSRG